MEFSGIFTFHKRFDDNSNLTGRLTAETELTELLYGYRYNPRNKNLPLLFIRPVNCYSPTRMLALCSSIPAACISSSICPLLTLGSIKATSFPFQVPIMCPFRERLPA
ncbi:hypothetical protein SAMN05192529_10499 [Arachidicoccus rhizosphaerae]|uniref:Uncharacterized protein n=1 Tax=Arachidicoccus rhizosphaerae TaxID=551991 RepID=A0A1H3WYW9_9BACT|nr:hypothetical protein SAMN05192529_10499 [Arachidicoccus rhizosphaerae]